MQCAVKRTLTKTGASSPCEAAWSGRLSRKPPAPCPSRHPVLQDDPGRTAGGVDGRSQSRKQEKRPVQRCQPEPARHTGRFKGGNHPLLIDHPVLPFVRSKSSPVGACALAGDSLCRRLQPRSPGSATPTAGCLDPVARFVLPRPVVVCTPVTRSTPFRQHHLGRSPVARFRLRWQRMIPHRPRFRLVNPVGSRSRPPPQGEALLARGRSSGSGWHALAGASPTLLPLFRQVKRYFLIHRVIHQITPPSPEVSGSSTIRAQGDAQLYAQLARRVRRIAGRRSGLVDDRQSSGHNHRRDVADRHPSRLHHHHSIAHVEHPRAPAAVLRGGCFISRMPHHSDTRSDRTSV